MRFVYRLVTIFLLATSFDVAWGQEQPTSIPKGQVGTEAISPASGAGSTFDQRYPRYLLRPSDVLDITFPLSPEFNQTVTVQPDGYVNLRLVGDLLIQEKSVAGLTDLLQKAYGKVLNEPIINVELKDFERPYFIANGQFGHPGKYDLRGETTLAEAVAIAGGFTPKAKHSEVIIFRRTAGGWTQAKKIDVKRMLANADLSEDVELRAGDLIYVPQNKVSKIHDILPNTGMGFSIP